MCSTKFILWTLWCVNIQHVSKTMWPSWQVIRLENYFGQRQKILFWFAGYSHHNKIFLAPQCISSHSVTEVFNIYDPFMSSSVSVLCNDSMTPGLFFSPTTCLFGFKSLHTINPKQITNPSREQKNNDSSFHYILNNEENYIVIKLIVI